MWESKSRSKYRCDEKDRRQETTESRFEWFVVGNGINPNGGLTVISNRNSDRIHRARSEMGMYMNISFETGNKIQT